MNSPTVAIQPGRRSGPTEPTVRLQSVVHTNALAASTTTTSIQTDNVRASYAGKEVLSGITLELPAGGVTAFFGPSGSGKSTFLRCINRTHELQHKAVVTGTVLLNGQDIYSTSVDPATIRRRVGMVFQKPTPFMTMSIRDNILSGPKLSGLDTNDQSADELVERVLKSTLLWTELRDLLQKKPNVLTAGQQQRLCVARALALKPEVVLFDEPCSTLDPIASAHIEELILSMRGQYTVVIVTHNIHQAARLASHTGFFLQGRLVEFGRTQEMFASPRQRETEDYITGKFG